jgi:adenylate cyclase
VARVAGAVSHSGSGFPKDKLSAMYVERCRHFMENPPGDDWNGVWTMTEK